MTSLSHHLNIYSPDGNSKLDIDVLADKVQITTTGGQPIEFSPVVKVGAIDDLEAKFTATDAAIAAGNAGSAAASALVQQNLDAYESSNNTALGVLSATVTSNKAISDANHAADAAARAALETKLQAEIDTEETDRKAADATLTADLATETSNRAAAITAEAAVRTSADASLSSEIATERGRIDGILNGSTVDLDTLKEIVDAFQQAGGDILSITTDIQSQLTTLTQRVDALTGDTQTPSYEVRPLAAVVSELEFKNDQAFLTDKDFHLTYDFTDRFSASSSSLVGWSQVKAETIAVSGGVLTGSSSDADVKAFIVAGLTAAYGTKFSGDAEAAKLDYTDSEHYLLEINMASGSKPYFQGSAQTSLADISWSLSYCSTAGDAATKFSTILSGTAGGKTLYIAPSFSSRGVEFPVGGVGGSRDGSLTTIDSLTIA